MTPQTKRKLVQRVLSLKAQIKTADEALAANLDRLGKVMHPSELIRVAGKTYEVKDIFTDGNSTWRPARVHRFEVKEVKTK